MVRLSITKLKFLIIPALFRYDACMKFVVSIPLLLALAYGNPSQAITIDPQTIRPFCGPIKGLFFWEQRRRSNLAMSLLKTPVINGSISNSFIYQLLGHEAISNTDIDRAQFWNRFQYLLFSTQGGRSFRDKLDGIDAVLKSPSFLESIDDEHYQKMMGEIASGLFEGNMGRVLPYVQSIADSYARMARSKSFPFDLSLAQLNTLHTIVDEHRKSPSAWINSILLLAKAIQFREARIREFEKLHANGNPGTWELSWGVFPFKPGNILSFIPGDRILDVGEYGDVTITGYLGHGAEHYVVGITSPTHPGKRLKLKYLYRRLSRPEVKLSEVKLIRENNLPVSNLVKLKTPKRLFVDDQFELSALDFIISALEREDFDLKELDPIIELYRKYLESPLGLTSIHLFQVGVFEGVWKFTDWDIAVLNPNSDYNKGGLTIELERSFRIVCGHKYRAHLSNRSPIKSEWVNRLIQSIEYIALAFEMKTDKDANFFSFAPLLSSLKAQLARHRAGKKISLKNIGLSIGQTGTSGDF
jgi:hypothetical protein